VSRAWKTVRLGEVINQRKEFIEIDDGGFKLLGNI